jgi:hypothetical protein
MARKKIIKIELIDAVDFNTIISLALRVSFSIGIEQKSKVISTGDDHDLQFADLVDVIWHRSGRGFTC